MPYRRFVSSLVLAVVLLAGAAGAQETESTPISFIRVEGTFRIEPETVRTYMVVRVGQNYDTAAVDRSVKTLFSSGFFSDVTIRREGDGLVVTVVENPIINRVAFEGNNQLRDDSLEEEVDLKPRHIYTRAKVRGDVARLIEIYRRSGRFAARIEPKLVQLDQNRVDLIFEIDEGPVTGIRAIDFIGNEAFDDGRLKSEIATSESRWWRFLSANDNYDPDRIAFDRELLRRFYLSKGYADFRVVDSTAELARDGSAFFITFRIEEGAPYTFAEARVANSVAGIEAAELETHIVHRAGETYDSRKLDATLDRLTEVVGEKGFAFADIRPRVRRDPEAREVHVAYEIEQGKRVYIERIDINGNNRTRDEVIRREMRLAEGDAFNRILLGRAERNIRALRYFEKVEVSESPGSTEDRTIIDVDVEEQSTGELSFGLGYSSADSLTAEISLSERNFLGRGQTLDFLVRNGTNLRRYLVGFTEPYFLDRNLSAGFNLFRIDREYSETSTIQTIEAGVDFALNFPVSEHGRLGITIGFSNDELINESSNASINPSYELFKQEVGYFYAIDRRDDAVSPTDGWSFGFGQDLAGLVGDVSFLRTSARADFYEEIAEGWVFHLRGTLGLIHNYKRGGINYNDRFFRGGRSFRGFERSGVGPRQISTDYALGANRYFIGTAEVSLPLGIPRELGIRTDAFIDFGVMGDTDAVNPSNPSDIVDDMAFRATTGLSISWRSPFGPIRFDLAHPIVKEDYDRTRRFRFSVGTRF